DDLASVRVAPNFVSGNGFDPLLILTNPNGSPVQVTVTLFGENGGSAVSSLQSPVSRPFTIPRNGTLAINTVDIAGRLVFTGINGWVRIDSPNIALSGLVTVDQARNVVSVPLQTAPLNRSVYENVYGDGRTGSTTNCTFVNPSVSASIVETFLVHEDGTT